MKLLAASATSDDPMGTMHQGVLEELRGLRNCNLEPAILGSEVPTQHPTVGMFTHRVVWL